jgi:hypothetical protein
MRPTILPFILAALCGWVCGCEPAPFPICEGVPDIPVVEGAVWHRDVRPIVESRCATCHVAGGIGPFPLETLADVTDHLAAVGDAVVSRRMPPWMPAKCCNEFRSDPSLTPAQIGTITSWIDAGAPEGDPSDVGKVVANIGSLPRVDATLVPNEPYLPNVEHTDEMRCFMLDWPFTEKKFVTGFEVVPDARAQIHHVMLLTAPGIWRGTYETANDADDGAGWNCPGGLVGGVDDWIGGWSPGWEGQEMPENTGHQVDADDVVLMTIHYTRPHDANVDITDDLTSVDLMVADEVDDTLISVWVANSAWPLGGMPIPKGEKDVVFRAEYDPTDVLSFGAPIEIIGVNLHMHERGRSGVVGVKRKDGVNDCLVQIDDYDFAWQGDYMFAEPRTVSDGDLLYMDCHFDNGEGHQRIVDGVPDEPRDLNWGDEGEMCEAFVTAKKPK